MKVNVTARYWSDEFETRFGLCGSTYEFPDDLPTFIREFVVPLGRFEVRKELDGTLTFDFQNDYD